MVIPEITNQVLIRGITICVKHFNSLTYPELGHMRLTLFVLPLVLRPRAGNTGSYQSHKRDTSGHYSFFVESGDTNNGEPVPVEQG